MPPAPTVTPAVTVPVPVNVAPLPMDTVPSNVPFTARPLFAFNVVPPVASTVPLLIVLPPLFTARLATVNVPTLLRLSVPFNVVTPTNPVPESDAPAASVSLPLNVPFTMNAEAAFCVALPVIVPLLNELPEPLTLKPLVNVRFPLLRNVLDPVNATG